MPWRRPTATITITGTVVQVDMNSSTPFPLAIVSLVDSPGAMADAVTTDGAGAFSLVIQTGGNPVDGALDVVGARETLSYFSRPLVADLANATIQVFDNTLFQDTASVCGRPFDPQRPTVIAFVIDAQGNPVDGAPLTSSPAATWCGQKAGGGIVTDTSGADGFAFAFELPPGSVQIRFDMERTRTSIPSSLV